ncbi:MAG: TolC family protein [Betaproteobacteria bacterium]|nr:TolC family protein [Betaproteobacteria bacterium]
MKKMYWIACLLVVSATEAQVDVPVVPGKPLTLTEAWRLGESNSVKLKAAYAAVDVAEGHAADTRGLLWNNPEISAERTQRKAPVSEVTPTTTREWAVGISQTLEVAGQQGYRREAALQGLATAQFLAQETERDVRAEIERRFVQVLALQSRIGIEQASLSLVDSTATFAGKRVTAGEDSKLDGNMALIEAGRARNQLSVLTDQLLQARAELGEILQWPPITLPEVVGDLEVSKATQPLDKLLSLTADRAHLKALQAKENAASSRLHLERAARFPDVTVGLGVGREGQQEFREKTTLFTVSVPLPLFKRNAGNVAQANADLFNARAERRAGERDTEANVRVLWHRHESLIARVKTLRDAVLPALEENQRLSQTALREGEISLAQQIAINRQLLEGRRDLVEATTELRTTRIALYQAAGISDAVPR